MYKLKTVEQNEVHERIVSKYSFHVIKPPSPSLAHAYILSMRPVDLSSRCVHLEIAHLPIF